MESHRSTILEDLDVSRTPTMENSTEYRGYHPTAGQTISSRSTSRNGSEFPTEVPAGAPLDSLIFLKYEYRLKLDVEFTVSNTRSTTTDRLAIGHDRKAEMRRLLPGGPSEFTTASLLQTPQLQQEDLESPTFGR